jgi:hypothetical protein
VRRSPPQASLIRVSGHCTHGRARPGARDEWDESLPPGTTSNTAPRQSIGPHARRPSRDRPMGPARRTYIASGRTRARHPLVEPAGCGFMVSPRRHFAGSHRARSIVRGLVAGGEGPVRWRTRRAVPPSARRRRSGRRPRSETRFARAHERIANGGGRARETRCRAAGCVAAQARGGGWWSIGHADR